MYRTLLCFAVLLNLAGCTFTVQGTVSPPESGVIVKVLQSSDSGGGTRLLNEGVADPNSGEFELQVKATDLEDRLVLYVHWDDGDTVCEDGELTFYRRLEEGVRDYQGLVIEAPTSAECLSWL